MNKVLAALGIALGAIATQGGRLLVVERLRRADLILVLSGERKVRLQHAFRLFRQGWADTVVIVALKNWRIYTRTEAQLAEELVSTLPPDLRRATHVLQILGDSTLEEVVEIGEYMDSIGARSVLLVTSDYHTRRTLDIFRRVLPDKQVGISGAHDPTDFDVLWWQRRAWAKRTAGEWTRLLWWLLLERRGSLPRRIQLPQPTGIQRVAK